MTTNTKITLYTPLNGLYVKQYVNALLIANKISTFNKTGLATSDSATVFIPLLEFKNSKEVNLDVGKTFIVEGECDIDIDSTTQKKLSESLTLLKTKNFYTVTNVDFKNYGSVKMWHFQLGLR